MLVVLRWHVGHLNRWEKLLLVLILLRVEALVVAPTRGAVMVIVIDLRILTVRVFRIKRRPILRGGMVTVVVVWLSPALVVVLLVVPVAPAPLIVSLIALRMAHKHLLLGISVGWRRLPILRQRRERTEPLGVLLPLILVLLQLVVFPLPPHLISAQWPLLILVLLLLWLLVMLWRRHPLLLLLLHLHLDLLQLPLLVRPQAILYLLQRLLLLLLLLLLGPLLLMLLLLDVALVTQRLEIATLATLSTLASIVIRILVELAALAGFTAFFALFAFETLILKVAADAAFTVKLGTLWGRSLTLRRA